MYSSYEDWLFTKAILLFWHKYYGTKDFVNPLHDMDKALQVLQRDNKKEVKEDENYTFTSNSDAFTS